MRILLRNGTREVLLFTRERFKRFDEELEAARYLESYARSAENVRTLRDALFDDPDHAHMAQAHVESLLIYVAGLLRRGEFNVLPDREALSPWAWNFPSTPSFPSADTDGAGADLAQMGEEYDTSENVVDPLDVVPESVVPPWFVVIAAREADSINMSSERYGLDIDLLKHDQFPAQDESTVPQAVKDTAISGGAGVKNATALSGVVLTKLVSGDAPSLGKKSDVAKSVLMLAASSAATATTSANKLGSLVKSLVEGPVDLEMPSTKVGPPLKELTESNGAKLLGAVKEQAAGFQQLGKPYEKPVKKASQFGENLQEMAKDSGRLLSDQADAVAESLSKLAEPTERGEPTPVVAEPVEYETRPFDPSPPTETLDLKIESSEDAELLEGAEFILDSPDPGVEPVKGTIQGGQLVVDEAEPGLYNFSMPAVERPWYMKGEQVPRLVTHVVRAGQTFKSVARLFGLDDWSRILNHPFNKNLAERRKLDDSLRPGDVLYVPDARTKVSRINTAEPTSLLLVPPIEVPVPRSVHKTTMQGIYFETNKAFLLPGAMDNIQALKAFYDSHSSFEVLVVGHTDTAGSREYNRVLSEERAAAMAAYLRDDVDHWKAWFGVDKPSRRRWGTQEIQHMLSVLPDTESPFWKGRPDGKNTSTYRAAVRAFQGDAGLGVDGIPGPNTQGALVKAYMGLDGTSLPEGTPVATHGCGETHPAVATEDGVSNAANRRVEIFFFEDGLDPAPQECAKFGCDEYAKWTAQVDGTTQLTGPQMDIPTVSGPTPAASPASGSAPAASPASGSAPAASPASGSAPASPASGATPAASPASSTPAATPAGGAWAVNGAVVEGTDFNAVFVPGHDCVLLLDDDQMEELREGYGEIDALIDTLFKASTLAEKEAATALLRDKASVDKREGKEKKGVAELVVLTSEHPETRYIPWEWLDFKVGAAGSEIEMHRKRGRGAAWLKLDRPDLKDKSLKKRWGDWSGLEKSLDKWNAQAGQDGDNFLVDDDIEGAKTRKKLVRKVANSVQIWGQNWSKEGSIQMAAGKVEVKTDTYDGTAEAAFLRLAGKATGKAEVSLTKLELSGKLEGSFHIADAKVTVNSYTPDRDGVRLQIPKDISKGWKDESNLVSIGAFRFKLSGTLEGSLGAIAMVGGAISLGMGEDGEPMVAAGANATAGAFAGARGAARIDGAYEWQHPDLKHLSKKFQDQAKTNDGFFTLAKTGAQGEASVGIGAEATINFGYNEEKKCYEFRARAGLTVGVGLGGELLFEIQVDKIWMLADIVYLALRECDLKTLIFVTVAAFYAIIYLGVAAILYATGYAVINFAAALSETLLEGGKALYDAVFGGEALERAEELADKLRKTAIANPGWFVNLLPTTRGKILDLLCQSSAMSDEENIEDAVLFVLYPVTTRREYERVLEGMYKCEKFKEDFANNKKIKLKDRGKAQTHAQDRIEALLDGNEQTLFDEFVRDLASGAPKATPRRPLAPNFVARAMGQQVARAMADELGVAFTGFSHNPTDFRVTANAKITAATWSQTVAYVHDTVTVTVETQDIAQGAEVAVEQWDADTFADDYMQTNKGEIGADGKCTLTFKLLANDNWEDEAEVYLKVKVAGLYRTFKGSMLSLKIGEFTGAEWGASATKMWETVDLTVEHAGIPAGTGLEIIFYEQDWGLLPDDKLQSIKVKAGRGGKTVVPVEISHHDGGKSENSIYPEIKTTDYVTGETGAFKVEIKRALDSTILKVEPPTTWGAKWREGICDRHDTVHVDFNHSGFKPGQKVVVKVYEKDVLSDDLIVTAKGQIAATGSRTSVAVNIDNMDLGWAEGDNTVEFTLVIGTYEEEFTDGLVVRVPAITSATWSQSTINLGEVVGITIEGHGFKSGTPATIYIWEDDVGAGGDDLLRTIKTSWAADRITLDAGIFKTDGEWEGSEMECYLQVKTDGFEKTFDTILIVKV